MKDKRACDPGRRMFLAAIPPACALACLGPKDLLALAQTGDKAQAEAPHKFDADFGQKLTLRQYFDAKFRDYIDLAKDVEAELGKDRATEFLKERTIRRMTEYGKRQAERSPDNSFETYVAQFRSGYDKVLTLEVVEDTDKAFELNVTECIWADTFLRADAGHIGYCSVCWGDYAWPRAFNEKIEMVRDKTLMQGHDHCNHRYLWKG